MDRTDSELKLKKLSKRKDEVAIVCTKANSKERATYEVDIKSPAQALLPEMEVASTSRILLSILCEKSSRINRSKQEGNICV